MAQYTSVEREFATFVLLMTDLIAGSMEELAELTTRLDTTSCKYGMEIRAEESKVLSMGVDKRTVITIRGAILETARSFKYLAARTTEDGRSEKEIRS